MCHSECVWLPDSLNPLVAVDFKKIWVQILMRQWSYQYLTAALCCHHQPVLTEVTCHCQGALGCTGSLWQLFRVGEPAHAGVILSTSCTDVQGHAISGSDSFICFKNAVGSRSLLHPLLTLPLQLQSWAGTSTQEREHASHRLANSEGPIRSWKLCGIFGPLLQTLWVETFVVFNSCDAKTKEAAQTKPVMVRADRLRRKMRHQDWKSPLVNLKTLCESTWVRMIKHRPAQGQQEEKPQRQRVEMWTPWEALKWQKFIKFHSWLRST